VHVALERGGVVIAAGDYDRFSNPVQLGAPLRAREGDELVVDGCGGSSRIPIAPHDEPAPVVTDLGTDGESLQVAWTTSGHEPTGLHTLLSTGVSADACHTAGAGLGRLTRSTIGPGWGRLSVSTMYAQGAYPTAWGEANVWGVSTAVDSGEVAVPIRVDDRWWDPGRIAPEVDLVVNGSTYPSGQWTWLIDRNARYQLAASDLYVEITAGAMTDTILVGGCLASIHHVPTDDLELSFDGNQTLAFATGPVPLVCEADPTASPVLELTVSLEHPRIARPVAP
jgi:hypothetical protein